MVKEDSIKKVGTGIGKEEGVHGRWNNKEIWKVVGLKESEGGDQEGECGGVTSQICTVHTYTLYDIKWTQSLIGERTS